MTTDYPTDEVPATPEYVLDVLRESVRLQVGWDDLTFDSEVGEVVAAYNDLAWPTTRLLADLMNATFDVRIPLVDWERSGRQVWSSVGGLCEFLASRVTRPIIRPWKHVAGECNPAGAFLTVRALLVSNGEASDRITPSSPLGPCIARLFHTELYGRLLRIAPRQLPRVRINYRRWVVRACATLALVPAAFTSGAGIVLLLFAIPLLDPAMVLMGAGWTTAGFAALRWLNRFRQPTGMELSGLHTFRDLAYTLAGQPPRRRIQPTP